jgi:anti-sigma factor RsiW
MRHYSEDELILYRYGEGRHRERVDEHLQACDACASTYRSIAGTLATVGELDIPERDDRYGLEVWQRIRHRLPVQEAPWWMAWYRPALAGAIAALIVAAFVAGRFWSRPTPEPSAPVEANETLPADAGERVRLAAIGDHLERSGRVLLDLVNTDGLHVDVSGQQAWASDLIDANRLYRHAAERAGEDGIASVLDELERNLLEIVHGPSTLTPAELEAVRVRLDAGALLFKVRILSDELRERELAPSQPRKTT